MQRAHARMRIPGAARAVAREDLRQIRRIFRKVFQRHRAVFNEAHGLAVALQTHHDVEASLPHFPQIFLRSVVGHLYDSIRQTKRSNQIDQPLQLALKRVLVLTRKFNKQNGIRLPDERSSNSRRKGRVR